MVVEKNLADLFRVLSQPTRLQILHIIGLRDVCVGQMEVVLDKRQAYISQQLSILREAKLVDAAKSGRYNFYRLSDPKVLDVVQAAADYLRVEMPPIDVPDVSELSSCEYSPSISEG